MYKKVVEIDDLDAVGFFNLGKILHKTKPKEAIQQYKKAIFFDSTFDRAYCNLGLAYLDQNKVSDAV